MKARFIKLRKLHLSDDERQDIRDHLALSLGVSVRKKGNIRHHISWPLVPLFLNHKSMFISIVVVVALALSGATGVAAENALPGEALYSFKTHVNERVRSALAVGLDREAELQADLAGDRLRETALLAAQGKLNQDISARIEERFELHVKKTRQLIERLEAQGNSEAAARLGASLEAQIEANAALLEKLENGSKADLEKMRERVSALREDLRLMKERAHAELETELGLKAEAEHAAEVRQDRIEEEIERVKEFLKDAEASAELDAEILAKAKASIADAEHFYAEGKADVEEGTFVEAIRNFNQAHKETVEAKVFTKAADRVLKAIDERERKEKMNFEKDKEAKKEKFDRRDQNSAATSTVVTSTDNGSQNRRDENPGNSARFRDRARNSVEAQIQSEVVVTGTLGAETETDTSLETDLSL
ncbi:MAG: hypothetical protein HYY51_04380 [Candidatus Magasanikbacteria bacterium]|nr:hypothetical protein [Candidatus Magasanikbacteria bacterium]